MYVAPTQQLARDAAKIHGLPMEAVTWWSLSRIYSLRPVRTVVMDEVGKYDKSEGDPVELMKQRQATHGGPCQIIAFH
ncbi:terminase large subunit [Bordetella phage PY223]